MSDDSISFHYDSDSYNLEDDDEDIATPFIPSLAPELKNFKHWTLESFITKKFVAPCFQLKQLQLPQCSMDDIYIMYLYYKWQIDSVINNYYEDHQKLLDNCGLVVNPHNVFQKSYDFQCQICFEDYPQTTTFQLTCGHEYCTTCYGNYVEAQIPHGKLITCMNPTCNLTIPHRIVQKLYETVKSASEHFKYAEPLIEDNDLLKSSVKLYIDSYKRKFKWCPAPDCNTFIENIYTIDTSNDEELVDKLDGDEDFSSNPTINISAIPIVTCPNDHEFCYLCQYENHSPCPCFIVKAWIKKCEDDSETAHWIEANTHECPKCSSAIEKNGGCNHMTCRVCAFEFCWICFKDWALHGSQYYACAKYNPEEKNQYNHNQKENRKSLQRYLHYYKRFAVHESSMKSDLKTLSTVEEKMNIFMREQLRTHNSNLSWIDIEFFKSAHKSLTKSRKTLKWSYCFKFYLKSSKLAEIFEQNQVYLSNSVELLSKIFEEINDKKNKDNSTQLIMNNKTKIIHLSSLLNKQRFALIDTAAYGLKEHRLEFEYQ